MTTITRTTYVIGKLIAYFLLKISDLGNFLTLWIYNFAVVLCEGVHTFIGDIDYRYSHIIRMLNDGLQNSVGDVTGAINGMGNGVIWSLERSKNETFMAIKRSGDLFTNGAFGVREIFIQTGHTVWMLIMLTVQLLISIVTGCWNCTILTGSSIIKGILTAIDVCGVALINSVEFFISVPLQSVIGCILLYIVYRNSRILFNILRWHDRIIRQACNYIIDIVTIVCTKIFNWLDTVMQFVGLGICWMGRIAMWLPNKLLFGESICAKEGDKQNLCVVCHDQHRSVLLLPCKHLCLCRDCYRKLKDYNRQCPLCRTAFRHNMKVYI